MLQNIWLTAEELGLGLQVMSVFMLRAVDHYGLLGAATRITAIRDRDAIALIDELGAQLWCARP